MAPSTSTFIAASILAAHATAQAINPQLVGTWTTKSSKVLTGPGFYNYAQNQFTEPPLTGVSYSFTADGHYEEAYYRAISNPTTPTCPQGLIQWQHGTYVQAADTSMQLTPIAEDGRQLVSNPCSGKTSILSKYSQAENISMVEIVTDPYNNQLRLNLYGFDGNPYNPMWINSHTPQMLPTTTLTPASATSSPAGKSNVRRSDFQAQTVMQTVLEPLARRGFLSADRWFWLGVGMTGVGSILVFCC